MGVQTTQFGNNQITFSICTGKCTSRNMLGLQYHDLLMDILSSLTYYKHTHWTVHNPIIRCHVLRCLLSQDRQLICTPLMKSWHRHGSRSVSICINNCFDKVQLYVCRNCSATVSTTCCAAKACSMRVHSFFVACGAVLYSQRPQYSHTGP